MSAEGRTLLLLGTERGVGKTTIACAILERIRNLGHRSIGIIPIETGCPYGDNHDLIGRDGERLRASSSGPVPPLVVSPYRFAADDHPEGAAGSTGLELELSDLASAVDAAAEFGTVVIVEGPHHAMAPLATDGLTIDLAKPLNAPVLIVAGTAESAQAVVDACAARGIVVAGVLPHRATFTLSTAHTFPGITEDDVSAHLEKHQIVERLIESLRPA